MSDLFQQVSETVTEQKGLLFAATPAIVHRGVYCGHSILAPNTSPDEDGDARGYVPVEWWIMSLTPAENEIPLENEGLTRVSISSTAESFFKDLVADDNLRSFLFGDYDPSVWPLTKVLDIGGSLIQPDFGDRDSEDDAKEANEYPAERKTETNAEYPPIPCHVHSGMCCNGHWPSPAENGKLEAYFFPPVDIPPYSRSDLGGIKTRLGIRDTVSFERFVAAMDKDFGVSDRLYSLLHEFDVAPYTGWTIRPGIVHAPGPFPTFEIQLPQDDFNLLSWQMGQRLRGPETEGESEGERGERAKVRASVQLRGAADVETVAKETIDWNLSQMSRNDFEAKFSRPSREISAGNWGKRFQIFFDEFYGEAFVVRPLSSHQRERDSRPHAGIVWSGNGLVNGNQINVGDSKRKEWFVRPNTAVLYENTDPENDLIIFTVYPFQR